MKKIIAAVKALVKPGGGPCKRQPTPWQRSQAELLALFANDRRGYGRVPTWSQSLTQLQAVT